MLDALAAQYAFLDSWESVVAHLALYTMGMIAALLTVRGPMPMQRAPYFATTMLTLICTSAAQLVWPSFYSAIEGGYLWLIVLIEILALVFAGYLFGALSVARAIDGYGARGPAAWAVIPVGYLVLLTKPSRHVGASGGILAGGKGVLAGFIFLAAASGLSAFATGQMVEAVTEATPRNLSAELSLVVRSQGVDAAVETLASRTRVPDQLDEETFLWRLTPLGPTLTYDFILSANIEELPYSIEGDAVASTCAAVEMQPILAAGATVIYNYYTADGRVLGYAAVVDKDCPGGTEV